MTRLVSWLAARSVAAQCALLAAVLGLCYLPALAGGFVWDDTNNLVQNDRLRSWQSLIEVFLHPAMWSANLPTGTVATYRPLALATMVVDQKLFGTNPLGYHLSSILIHLLAQTTSFLLLRRLLGRPVLAFALAVLGGLHPAAAEAVAWINGRSEPLCLAAGAGALFLCSTADFRQGVPAPLRALSIAALLLLSLLGKETGALFLPLALLLVFWLGPFRRDDGRRGWVLLAVLMAGGAYGLLRFGALHAEAVPQSARDPGQLGRLGVALAALWLRALQGALIPQDRALSQLSLWLAGLSSLEKGACVAFAVALLASLAYALARGQRLLVFGFLWWLGGLVPAVLLLLLSWPGFNRWLYVPLPGLLLGLALCGSLALAALRRLRPMLVAPRWPLALVLGVELILLQRCILVWRDDTRLFMASIEEAPDQAFGYLGLSVVAYRQARYAESEKLLREALRLDPARNDTYEQLALTLAAAGRCPESEALVERYGGGMYALGLLRQQVGRCHEVRGEIEEARARYQRCADTDPRCAASLERLKK